MAGHSKWKNIQARKSVQDAKKGKIFTKVTKELMLAARSGGKDPLINARLRSAIASAKAVNLPKDKIDQAIKKGSGELAGETFEEIMYEGYAPGGVAIMIEVATDNRNRTVADVRHILSKNGGSLGESGCVGWMFERKGIISFDKSKYNEDQLLEIGLEAGVDDVTDIGESLEVHTAPEDFAAAIQAFEDAEMAYENAELSLLPQNMVTVESPDVARKLLKLIDALEDSDDVQKVHANFDLPDEIMESLT